MPTRDNSANTLARWCDDTAYFCAISAAEIWRSGSAANSSRLYSARRVFCCSFMESQSMSLPQSGLKLEFKRNKRADHHALTAKKRQNQCVVPCQHGTHFTDTGLAEIVANRLQQLRPRACQSGLRVNVNRKHPATRWRAELPVTHLADGKADCFI